MGISLREERFDDLLADLVRRVRVLEAYPTTSLHLLDAADVTTQETVNGTSYHDLVTAGPTVTVDVTSGRLLVWLFAFLIGSETNTVYMSFALSGPESLAAADSRSIRSAADLSLKAGAAFLVEDLTPGAYTVTAKYRDSLGAGGVTAELRTLVALPF